ncbi:MAG: 4Fe-4S binding protein [Actinobacteria bacterium]|nr:4Fe-4S binding protein [Actinomycetota bacterium]
MLQIIKNFFINLGNIFKGPRTILYPAERIILPEGTRGLPRLRLNLDTLEIICSGCGTCARVCPEGCIEVKATVNEHERRSLDEISLDLSRCIFCGNCAEYCELKAIEMSYKYQLSEYELGSLKLEELELTKQADYPVEDFWA